MYGNELYFEKCNNNTMITYPFFFDKLNKLESILKIDTREKRIIPGIDNCKKCRSKKYYKLSNIVWPDNLEHIIQIHRIYPREIQ